MSDQFTLEQGSRLLSDWIRLHPDELQAKNEALEFYGKYFAPENLDAVTSEGFRGFLSFKNNQHWGHIQRHPEIYADYDRLRECLRILLNEDESIETRLNKIIPKDGPPFIKSLNRAVLTPILMCVYPDKYAVYNRRSEDGLTRLGLNRAKAKDSFGQRYMAINEACKEVRDRIGQPLPLVDLMLGLMSDETNSAKAPGAIHGAKVAEDDDDFEDLPAGDDSILFPKEGLLEEFLIGNWEKTAFGKALELKLHKDHPEDEDESARQYRTDVGYIDILARDKHNRDWIIIELKKGKESDKAVGQVLRYVGWVRKHKATGGENVRGIIVTSSPDDRIRYAIHAIKGISFYTYRLTFELNEAVSI